MKLADKKKLESFHSALTCLKDQNFKMIDQAIALTTFAIDEGESLTDMANKHKDRLPTKNLTAKFMQMTHRDNQRGTYLGKSPLTKSGKLDSGDARKAVLLTTYGKHLVEKLLGKLKGV